MVAVLVGLKLRLLRNALRQSVWRVVGLVLALAYGVFLVGLAVVGLVALRFTQVDVGPHVVVVGLTALTVGVTYGAPHHLVADGPLAGGAYVVVPTAGGQAWERLQDAAVPGKPAVSPGAPVTLGMPRVGAPQVEDGQAASPACHSS